MNDNPFKDYVNSLTPIDFLPPPSHPMCRCSAVLDESADDIAGIFTDSFRQWLDEDDEATEKE